LIWGTGTPSREFLFVDDMAKASVFIMELNKEQYEANTSPMLSHINVGFGSDISIRNLAFLLKEVIEYPGEIQFDTSKPDGTPRKLMDSSKIQGMGWQATKFLKEGLNEAYQSYLKFLDTPKN
jgi:GDP-L-fucose synthase